MEGHQSKHFCPTKVDGLIAPMLQAIIIHLRYTIRTYPSRIVRSQTAARAMILTAMSISNKLLLFRRRLRTSSARNSTVLKPDCSPSSRHHASFPRCDIVGKTPHPLGKLTKNICPTGKEQKTIIGRRLAVPPCKKKITNASISLHVQIRCSTSPSMSLFTLTHT